MGLICESSCSRCIGQLTRGIKRVIPQVDQDGGGNDASAQFNDALNQFIIHFDYLET